MTTDQEAMMEAVIISLSSGREEEHVWENGKEKEVCDGWVGWGISLRLLFMFPAQ